MLKSGPSALRVGGEANFAHLLEKNEAYRNVFNEAMVSFSTIEAHAVLSMTDFNKVKTIQDVGGCVCFPLITILFV
jgi:hypothetical protein